MKKGFLTFIILLCIQCSWGQTATQEAFDKACHCLAQTDFDQVDFVAIDSILEICIKEGLYTNWTGVLEEQGTQLGDDQAMNQLATKMHQYLTKNCPSFQRYNERLAAKKITVVRERNPADTGVIYTLDTKSRFPILNLLTNNNELKSFYWIREFDGSSRFFDGIKQYQAIEVEILWNTIEIYDISTKQYLTYKEIYQVEELRKIPQKDLNNRLKAYKKHLKSTRKSKIK